MFRGADEVSWAGRTERRLVIERARSHWLQERDRPRRRKAVRQHRGLLITLEDPVEYRFSSPHAHALVRQRKSEPMFATFRAGCETHW